MKDYRVSEHEADGSEAKEGERIVVAILPVLSEPTATVEPCDAALNDPALGFDHEALGLVAALDDLDQQVADGLA